jgi:hypothetical protein
MHDIRIRRVSLTNSDVYIRSMSCRQVDNGFETVVLTLLSRRDRLGRAIALWQSWLPLRCCSFSHRQLANRCVLRVRLVHEPALRTIKAIYTL